MNALQLSLDDCDTHRGGKETEHGAAEDNRPRRPRHREIVLRAFYNAPEGLSDFDLEPLTGLVPTSAGKRRLDLERAGLVEFADRWVTNDRGSTVRVHRITDAGRAWVETEDWYCKPRWAENVNTKGGVL